MRSNLLHITVLFFFVAINANAQISPGDLSNAHAELEGIMNCTECHILGGKISNDKCLDCHKELKSRIDQKKGFHTSDEVNNKDCASCHSDHHGRKFEMIRFNEDDFEHQLTGYDLTGQHKKIDCRECHKPDLIKNVDLKKNTNTFLGLEQECLSCHEDIHQKTLSQDCASCHTTEAFSPPGNFNHNKADFALVGQHRDVACIECHRMEKRNGKDFQRFVDIEFQNCTACHEDVHDNKFGRNCTECHSEESFKVASSLRNFNHQMTGFELQGKHRSVDCKKCHVANFTSPLPHNTCASCHQDYHEMQFAINRASPDCAECHTVNGFSGSLYTIDNHNESRFPLEEAHLATPCFACHKKEEKWSFRKIGERCVDCHQDVHEGYIDEKYYPDQSCESCHSVTRWQENRFDHSLTSFELLGAHATQECLVCHGVDNGKDGNKYENFQNISMECAACHNDVHQQQFERGGVTNCNECHEFESWGSMDFDHNKTAFKLDGKHVEVDCTACHKKIEEEGEIFVLYKIKKIECIDCHQ
ncbi:MAG: cytochrome c family protein [Cyclobacteriaceae bacterium]|nr:cytochrome c family protein [Cyclobacteriaceae bacterium]